MGAVKILKMIEEVDPSDTNTLCEIDARLECLVMNLKYRGYERHRNTWSIYLKDQKPFMRDVPCYTRSRDALKAIRPDGVTTGVSQAWSGGYWYGYGLKKVKGNQYLIFADCDTPELPTEELAELHAIIQAIECERNND